MVKKKMDERSCIDRYVNGQSIHWLYESICLKCSEIVHFMLYLRYWFLVVLHCSVCSSHIDRWYSLFVFNVQCLCRCLDVHQCVDAYVSIDIKMLSMVLNAKSWKCTWCFLYYSEHPTHGMVFFLLHFVRFIFTPSLTVDVDSGDVGVHCS